MRLVVILCLVLVINSTAALGSERPEEAEAGGESVHIEPLFSYGTLLDPKVQKRVIGRTIASVPDELEGYRKGEIVLGDTTYPIAVPDAEQSIAGGVINVTRYELKRVDRYEGRSYERAWVTLKSGIQAWFYRQPQPPEPHSIDRTTAE